MPDYSKNLEEGEDIVDIVRRHPITLFGPIFTAIFLLLADFFFLTWFFSKRGWGVLIFGIILFFSFYIALRTWVIWSKNVFIITNKRVIDVDQHGFFHKTVSECAYEKIEDVSYTVRGFFATLFHLGSIQIQTAGNTANLELHGIKNPQTVQEKITSQQREKLGNSAKNVSKEEVLSAVRKIRGSISEDEIRKLFRE